MEKGTSEKGCCKDEHYIVKTKTDTTYVTAIFNYTPAPDAIVPVRAHFYESSVACLTQPKITTGLIGRQWHLAKSYTSATVFF